MKNFKKIKNSGPNPTRKFRPRVEGEDRPMSFGPQILISSDKQDFVVSARLAGVPTIMASYEVRNGVLQPNLILDTNRFGRADNLLKSAPEAVVMSSDGQTLRIDATSKLLAIDTANDVEGIVQYRIGEDLKSEVLANFIRRPFEQILLSVEEGEDEDERANELFVYPVSGYGSFLVGVTNGVEKVLHLTIGKDGVVLQSEKHEYKRLLSIMQQWNPHLGIEAVITDGRLVVECKSLREHIPFERGVVRIHDNYQGEWTITPTHELVA